MVIWQTQEALAGVALDTIQVALPNFMVQQALLDKAMRVATLLVFHQAPYMDLEAGVAQVLLETMAYLRLFVEPEVREFFQTLLELPYNGLVVVVGGGILTDRLERAAQAGAAQAALRLMERLEHL